MVKILLAPKFGEEIKYCQDSVACVKHDNKIIMAISDGVSTSFMSKKWADLLVQKFCNNYESLNADNTETWLDDIRKIWCLYVEEFIKGLKSDDNDTWIQNENKYNRGESASATFTGIVLHNIVDQVWSIKIISIGDSCLLVTSDSNFFSYPYENYQQFTTFTKALNSRYPGCPLPLSRYQFKVE